MCVFDVDKDKDELKLIELAPGITVDEVRKSTGADFRVDNEVKTMKI